MLKESFQLDMNTMIEEAKDRGVRPEDLFSSYNLQVDPTNFFEEITAGTQEGYKKSPFLRIEKSSTSNEFYRVLLAYLDSEGTGNRNYKKLDPAEIRRDRLGEWHPSDGRHRAAFCMLLGIKLPVKRIFEARESLQLLEGDHTQQAVDAFGITYYKSRAGYMLKDGRLLDLTYGGNPREDHRTIQDAFDDMDLDSGSDYLIEFMNEGNIRCIPELPGIDLAVEPTDKQYTALKDYISYWIGHDRHFEVQFSDKNGNQVDWKEYNGFVSAAEILLDIKDHFSNDLSESWEGDYSVSDLIGTDALYHATYKPYWEQIKKDGTIKPRVHNNWDISDNCIYLSRDYNNAVSYAEEAENVPEEYLDQIVVLEIDANKLDIDLLNIDHNQAYGNYDEVDVEDPQTWIEFQYEGSIPLHCIKRVHDESVVETLNEVYPQKGETESDFINRFMRATAKEYPNVKQRYAVAHSYWNRRNLKESYRLHKSTAYMLRKDGQIFECNNYHPYILNVYDRDNDLESLVNERIDELYWFYQNTSIIKLKDYVRIIIKSASQLGMRFMHDDEEQFDRFRITDNTYVCKDKIELMSFVEWLNAETNQEFCRFRTSNLKFGGDSSDIYFRISSIGFNWFDLIWDIVYSNHNWLTTITISRDNAARNFTQGNCYKVGGKIADHMPLEEFINLPGNPVLESFNTSLEIIQRAYEQLHKGASLEEAYPQQHPRNILGLIRRHIKEELEFDLNNILARIEDLEESIQNNTFNIKKTGVGKYDEWLSSQSARDRDNVDLEFIYMTPREYFEACGQLFNNNFNSQVRQIENDKTINKELDKVYDSNEKMNLTLLDYVSDPPTQEGRHRMYVLAQKYGWDENKYPVAVFTVADSKRAEREKEERRQEKLYRYIDKAVMRALDFTYRNYEELKEQLEYYLEDYIENPELEISERGNVLAIIVNGLEYEINKNEFDWDEEKPEPDFSFDDELSWKDIELDDIIR